MLLPAPLRYLLLAFAVCSTGVVSFQITFTSWFKIENAWRWFGVFIGSNLIYNGFLVTQQYDGKPLAPFLSTSISNFSNPVIWSVAFVSVGIITIFAMLACREPAQHCGVIILAACPFALATMAVWFSPAPHVTSYRYLQSFIACMVAIAGFAVQEREQEGDVEFALRHEVKDAR